MTSTETLEQMREARIEAILKKKMPESQSDLFKQAEAQSIKWSAEASALIEWYKKYLNYLSKERKPEVRNHGHYRQIDKWIIEGPIGSKSEYVLSTLKAIKHHIEWLDIKL